MQTDEIRRHPDGSIDFDFYHAGARRMRAEAAQEILFSPIARRVATVATLGVLAIAIVGAALELRAPSAGHTVEPVAVRVVAGGGS